jgi:hypothetical protein
MRIDRLLISQLERTENKKYLGAAAIIGVIIFDVLVYQHQSAGFTNGSIPICYPSGEGRYDSVGNSFRELYQLNKGNSIETDFQ